MQLEGNEGRRVSPTDYKRCALAETSSVFIKYIYIYIYIYIFVSDRPALSSKLGEVPPLRDYILILLEKKRRVFIFIKVYK